MKSDYYFALVVGPFKDKQEAADKLNGFLRSPDKQVLDKFGNGGAAGVMSEDELFESDIDETVVEPV